MAGRIRDEDVALVRERSPIADVVGEYLQLRNAGGGSLKGLCPFHDEKTPSFNVTPARNLWYCFGCGEGGDVISFIQKIEHLSFVEAVEHLARAAGIQLRYEQGGYVPRNEQGQRQRLVEACRVAAEFYAEQLLSPEAQAGRRFLVERGFTRADAEHFGVGYAPASWEALTSHLRAKGFTDKEILLGGLASQGRHGLYDRFRGRLVWPVRDLSGEIVGFGARKLAPEDTGPKYLNTPETPLFKKSSLLYGLDLAKKEIVRKRQVVIVEGYTDVMACHLAGVTTAVATCGTSFGEEHLKILRRLLLGRSEFGGEVIFTFDGDQAGRNAALRAFAEEHGFASETFVAVQPDGLDPCDLRVQRGDAAVRDLIAAKQPLYEFMIRSKFEGYNLDTPEGRLAALDAAAPIVASIRNAGVRRLYGVSLDRWLGIMDEEFVHRRVREHMRRARSRRRVPPKPEHSRPAPSYDMRDPVVQRERLALKLAVQHPLLCSDFDHLDADMFTVEQHREVFQLIQKEGGTRSVQDPARWAGQLREAAHTEAQRAFLTQLAVEPIEIYGELDEHRAQEIISTIKIHSINRQITNLKSRLSRLDPTADSEEYQRIFAELMAAEQHKRMMREQFGGAM